MKLTRLMVFGAGYVFGAKAGRERYVQIIKIALKASERLDEYGARHGARVDGSAGDRPPLDV